MALFDEEIVILRILIGDVAAETYTDDDLTGALLVAAKLVNQDIGTSYVVSVSGAGDTFVAAFAFKYAKTFDAAVSIIYANEMASFVVNKRGVTTI